jgi:PKD domain
MRATNDGMTRVGPDDVGKAKLPGRLVTIAGGNAAAISLVSSSVSETPAVTETSWSRRTVTIASILFLFVLLPAHSQIPTLSQTPIPGTNRRIFIPTTPSGRGNASRFIVPPSPPATVISPSPTNEPLFRATLSASPSTTVEIGEEIWFKVSPQLPSGLDVQYNFDFGDRSAGVQTKDPQTPYTYSSPGPYRASVEIRVRGGRLEFPKIFGPVVRVLPRSRPSPTSTSTLVPITPSPTPYTPSSPIATALPTATPHISPPLEVYLSVDKNPTSIGDNVTFSITTNLANGHQRYRYEVDFGDGSKPSRTNSNSVPHIFKTAGNYTASVKVVGDRSQAHNELDIFVRERTTPRRLWVYVLIGFGVVALAYLVYPRPKPNVAMAARPTFHPHSDWDAPQKPPENLTINYELHFESNISSGQNRLQTDRPNLILRKAIQ